MAESQKPWTELDFESWKARQAQLLHEIEENQSHAMESRRNLVKQTKEFKQLNKEEQDQRLPDLLKLYQQEIDSLSKRLKSASEAFKVSFTPLSRLPKPTMEGKDQDAARSLESDLDIAIQENADLRGALELANVELSRRTAELQTSLKAIQEWEKIAELAAKKDQEIKGLSQALSEQERQAMLLSNRNEEIIVELGRLKKNLDELQQERVALDSKKSREETVKLTEFNMINGQLERCRNEIVDLQRENQILRLEADNLKADTPKTHALARMTELENDLDQLQQRLSKEKAEHSYSLAQKNKELAELRQQLASLEKAKEELDILKIQEFGDSFESQPNCSLSVLLQKKNKWLEKEMGKLRNDLQEMQQKYQESGEEPTEFASKQAEIATLPLASMNQGPDGIKRQIQQLQLKNSDLNQQLETQKLQTNRLQTDNIKLFERIKFLEAFNNKNLPDGEHVDSELGDLLQPYHHAYEEKHDPFRLLFKNEIIGRFKALGQTDRTIWRMGKIFLTNKFIRRFVAVYFVVLHLFMLYMLLRGDAPHAATALNSASQAAAAH